MHLLIGLVTLGLILIGAVMAAELVITLAVMVVMAPFAGIQALVKKLRS